ncbi:MAG: nickel pincer cofactor biosynthesis protein LarC [Desulfotignum sp.]|nr:nickel pincer cofactor biosynthesis protein LarC [Desulfotignum sp.]MCF8135747.1 nickel pincer cofactor biosynthesis protein LarC [Desulfotignum sp.]
MILYLDLVSGISGDMCLGALVDLGVDPGWLETQLTPLFAGFRITASPVFRSHLRAVDLTVAVIDTETSRRYADIRTLIQGSGLSAYVKKNSLTAFEKIARAEAEIHGQDLEDVHFHEIGGIDSLVDILGTFVCMEKLGITEVHASAVPLGSGYVDCAHGRIPVPVPATLAILEGIPVIGSAAKTEIVTPTGAALAVTLVTRFGPVPPMQIVKTGYGAGKRDTGAGVPNLLRMVLGKRIETSAFGCASPGEKKHHPGTGPDYIQHEHIAVITTQVDDMNPEILGFVMDHLLEKGALDVTYAPVYMKKNRPGTRMEVLCTLEDLSAMVHEILVQTTAIGVRYHISDRAVLHREQPCQMDTVFGPVAAKKIKHPDGSAHMVPEYEALAKIARQQDIPLKTVYEKVAGNSLDRENIRL